MIIIGDVHGCYKTLMALITQLPKNEKICFVGDLIDRGNDSKKVMDFVLREYDCVKGNHEEMMLTDRDMWYCNGGRETEASINSYPIEQDKTINYYKSLVQSLPYYLEYDLAKDGRKLFVCHAGLLSEDIQKCIDTQMITWYRGDLPDIKKYFQVIGHTPVKEPIITEHYANIDTGCVFTKHGYGKLTGLQFPEMKIYQQENIE